MNHCVGFTNDRAAVLSMSTVVALVGASYGQEPTRQGVRIGFQKYGKLVLLRARHA